MSRTRRVALALMLTAGAPMAAAADVLAAPAPTADRPGIHGMLLVGQRTLFVSHLPMFHSPHDYQAIAEVALDGAAADVHRRDAERHPDALYTVEPTTEAVLPTLFQVGARYTVNLYRGHFERGGEEIAAAVPVTVRHIVHFRRFQPSAHAPRDHWLAFGRAGERFLAHRIEAPDDFDQVLALGDSGAVADDREVVLAATGAQPLAARTPAGTVARVIYTEYDDLRSPGRR